MGYIKNLIVIAYKKTTKFNTSLNEKILPADNPYHETMLNMIDVVSKNTPKNNNLINSPDQLITHKFNIGDTVYQKMDNKKIKHVVLSIGLEFQGAITYNVLSNDGLEVIDECMLELLYKGGDSNFKN